MKTISTRALQLSPIEHLARLRITYARAMHAFHGIQPARAVIAANNLLRVACEMERRTEGRHQ